MSYAIDIDDIKLLADVAAQLDHVKNLIPAECADVHESFVLAGKAHATLERIPGADAHLVYSPDPEEQTA